VTFATRLLPPDAAGLHEAANIVRGGLLVAFPTETVYGLGADATQPQAVAMIFQAKGRPHFNPLICHYSTAMFAFHDVEASSIAEQLAAAFWPGPLTLVLPRRVTCPVALLAGAGLDTLAVRVPAHPLARAFLAEVGKPVAAPSANRSGSVSATTPAHVLEGLAGRIAAVLDGGACPVGVESTVLDLTGDRPFLLRPGGTTREEIEAVVGPIGVGIPHAVAEAHRSLRSPGLLVSHYAPSLPLRVKATSVTAEEALLAFGPPLPSAGLTYQLSETSDVTEAAARLFDGLRWLDREGAALGLRRIAAMPVPEAGLGAAVNDRLTRAAAPRD
jgi:L-threonylcarbamoyladenylate synthase